MKTDRECDDRENLPPAVPSRYTRLRNCVLMQWAGLGDIALLKWSVANGWWEMWRDPVTVSEVSRPPDDFENLPAQVPSRYARLVDCINLQWAGLDSMCAIQWENERWIMWNDPEP